MISKAGLQIPPYNIRYRTILSCGYHLSILLMIVLENRKKFLIFAFAIKKTLFMRLMIILPRVPYPTEKGDKLRAFHQIKYLSQKHEIILCAMNDEPLHPEAHRVLSQYCKQIHIFNLKKWGFFLNVVRCFFKGIPFQIAFFYRRYIKKEIQKLIQEQQPEHIYCQLLRVAEYVKDVDIQKTLDYQDVFSMGVKRRIEKVNWLLKPLMYIEYKRLARYENTIFSWFDNKTIISEPDRDLIEHKKKNDIVIVPNGVDSEFFYPQETEAKYDVVFTGNMGYPPNIDAAVFLASKILPIVQKTIPNCKILIAGATPHAKVKALASENVEISGWLDDIRTAYASSKVFIAPMQIGTGLQNKLLEAMSMRKPSITTPLANSALQAIPNSQILIGDDEVGLAENIVKLLTDKELANRIAENGRNYILENFSWDSRTKILEQLMLKK